MALTLGKTFDCNYSRTIPFLDGYYNIGTFFNKKSPFLLFRVDPQFEGKSSNISSYGIKINMFKNLESSKFTETFINLHNFRKSTLDIINQYDSIKSDNYNDISSFLNETINLSKVDLDDRVLFDTLTLYGFTLTAFNNEFIFIIAERQNIIRKLGKKVVRSTGIQIGTSRALNLLNEFHNESTIYGKKGLEPKTIIPSNEKEVINIDE
jgi:hypothetical protein